MIKELLEYQQIDGDLRAIEMEIGNSEERKKAFSAKKFLDTVNESVIKMESRAEELSQVYVNMTASHKTLSDSAKEFEQAISSSEDVGEIQYLQKKADELLQKITKLENEINTMISEMKSVLSNYSQLKKKTLEAKNQYNEYGIKYKKLKESKQAQITATQNKLAEIEKTVPKELMEKYKAKRKDKMYPVLFQLQNNLCSHCRMDISMVQLAKLNKGEVIECDNCRCLLYKNND